MWGRAISKNSTFLTKSQLFNHSRFQKQLFHKIIVGKHISLLQNGHKNVSYNNTILPRAVTSWHIKYNHIKNSSLGLSTCSQCLHPLTGLCNSKFSRQCFKKNLQSIHNHFSQNIMSKIEQNISQGNAKET